MGVIAPRHRHAPSAPASARKCRCCDRREAQSGCASVAAPDDGGRCDAGEPDTHKHGARPARPLGVPRGTHACACRTHTPHSLSASLCVSLCVSLRLSTSLCASLRLSTSLCVSLRLSTSLSTCVSSLQRRRCGPLDGRRGCTDCVLKCAHPMSCLGATPPACLPARRSPVPLLRPRTRAACQALPPTHSLFPIPGCQYAISALASHRRSRTVQL